MQPALDEESGRRDTQTPSRLSVTACLRCREQKVSHAQFNHRMEHFAERILCSLSVVVNTLRVIGVVASTPLVPTRILQIAEAHEPNSSRGFCAGKPKAVVIISLLVSIHTGLGRQRHQLLGNTRRTHVLCLERQPHGSLV